MEKGIVKNDRIHKFGEFDLMKAIAVLGLPIVHLLEEGIYDNYVSQDVHKLEALIVALCIVGPSIFMMCMGFSMGGARNTPKSLMKQGLRFLLLGAILNLVRWILPALLVLIVRGEPMTEDIYAFFVSDIYYFVGVFCLFLALMRKLKLSTQNVLAVTIVMLTVNTLLTPYMPKIVTNESIMKYMLCFSPIVFLSYLVSLSLYGHDIMKVMVSPLNSYITDLPNVVLMISLALFLFAVLYYICKAIDKSRFMNFMMKISTYIVPFYMLQWVLVAWTYYAMDLLACEEGVLTLTWFIFAAALITGICVYVAVKHGMRATKFLARLSTFNFKRKKKAMK